MKRILLLSLAVLASQGCTNQPATIESGTAPATSNKYLDYSGRDDA